MNSVVVFTSAVILLTGMSALAEGKTGHSGGCDSAMVDGEGSPNWCAKIELVSFVRKQRSFGIESQPARADDVNVGPSCSWKVKVRDAVPSGDTLPLTTTEMELPVHGKACDSLRKGAVVSGYLKRVPYRCGDEVGAYAFRVCKQCSKIGCE